MLNAYVAQRINGNGETAKRGTKEEESRDVIDDKATNELLRVGHQHLSSVLMGGQHLFVVGHWVEMLRAKTTFWLLRFRVRASRPAAQDKTRPESSLDMVSKTSEMNVKICIYSTGLYMKLAWKLNAHQALSSRSGQAFGWRPRLTNPLFFAILTARSFPDLSVATDAEVSVCCPENFSSLLAKTGCITICFPACHAANVTLYPLSRIVVKAMVTLFTMSYLLNFSCLSNIFVSR